ncbi:unnamed protein product, partial [Laminaria digitata]
MRGLKSIFVILTLAVIASPAAAQTASKLGQHIAWATYSYNSNGGKVCYVLSVPESKQPPTLDHGNIYFFVSMKPGQNVAFEPQFVTAYTMAENSKVTVTIDGKDFKMFVRDKSAWLENAAEEPQLVAAMKAGSAMSVAAQSRRGNKTSYSFSLKGITA